MRARAAAAAALAAAALTILAAPGGQASETGASAAADCVPVQHSKKVVKRVKVRRHGKVVKMKRKKTVRWETCEPATPATPTALAPCPVASSNVGVTARDRNPAQPRYSLSRLCVNAGTVRVQLENWGEDPHQLFIRPLGLASTEPTYRIPDTPPLYELEAWDGMGAPPTAEADVALTPGTWYLWCDLPDHEQLGMSASLQVR